MVKTEKKLNIPVRGEIASLTPYPPGKPIEELERELGLKGSIKLASNENPLGPSSKALEAIKGALADLNRYPDGSCFYLKRRLAEILKVPEDSLIIGNGSNEIIELLVRTFVGSGEEVIMGDPSFAVYPLITKSSGAVPVSVPLMGLTIDLNAMAERIGPRTRLIFISNPNNPTGTIVDDGELRGFLEKVPDDVIVCLDEAYYEYVTSPEFPRAIEYVTERRPVAVLRTFSKIYGLAGLRIGYGIAPPELVDYMDRVRQPFNVNSLAQAAALSALDDTTHVERSRRSNEEGLRYLFTELKEMGLECVETEANFFLVKVGDGPGIYDALLKRGVIVRPMKGYGLPEYIRITVGTREENERLVRELKLVREAAG